MLYIRARDIPVAIISLLIAVPFIFWLMPLLFDHGWSEGATVAVFLVIIVGSMVVGTFLWNRFKRFVESFDIPPRERK